jgi:hypothetical protein
MTENSSGPESAEDKKQKLSRREFLKLSALGALGLALPEMPKLAGLGNSSGRENINYFYVWHTKESDLEGFDEALKKCDVFSPEWIEWTSDDEDYLNKVSKGFISYPQIESDYSNNGFLVGMLKNLWNTRRRVKIFDIPKEHPLVEEFYRIQNEKVVDYTKSFDSHLLGLISNFQEEATWMRAREDFILKEKSNYVAELEQKEPFKSGQKVNLLMVYGIAHTRMLHSEKNSQSEARTVDFRFPEAKSHYLHSLEALRRYYFAQDSNSLLKVSYPDKELLSNVVMESLLINWLYPPNAHFFKNTALAVEWFRGVVTTANKSKLNAKVLWEVQRKMRMGRNDLKDSELPSEVVKMMVDNLRELGVDEKYISGI